MRLKFKTSVGLLSVHGNSFEGQVLDVKILRAVTDINSEQHMVIIRP